MADHVFSQSWSIRLVKSALNARVSTASILKNSKYVPARLL